MLLLIIVEVAGEPPALPIAAVILEVADEPPALPIATVILEVAGEPPALPIAAVILGLFATHYGVLRESASHFLRTAPARLPIVTVR